MTFSPDGLLLAMTGGDPILSETLDKPGQTFDTGDREPWQRLVEVQTAREIELQQEQADYTEPVFSADGRYLAAGKVVWDAATGRRLARAEERIIAFSPDANLLLTREKDVVRAWPWRSEDLLAIACRQLPRNLSGEEWLRHVSSEEPPARTCAGLR